MFQRFFRTLTVLACATAALHGCSCESPTQTAGSKVPERCEDNPQPLVAQKTDLLFVIDNSGSMKEEQDGVASELPTFVQELAQGGGLEQDFQVGVVTTSVYLNYLTGGTTTSFVNFPSQAGHLQPVPLTDGGTAGQPRFIHMSDPDLVARFARLVRQGTGGSGQETPFEAVRLALGDLASVPADQGGNGGFLRDGARLLVVVLTDEDDCSEQQRPPSVHIGGDFGRDYCSEQGSQLTPVGDYYTAFQRLVDGTGAKRDLLWAAIAPVGISTKIAQSITESVDGGQPVTHNVDCPTSNGPGYRQRQMAFLFDNRVDNLASICSPSYHDTLIAIAHLAAENQTVEMGQNVPDPGLLVVQVTRGDNSVQKCTVSNGGITFEPASGTRKARIHFNGSCLHRLDDKQIQVKMLCAG